jgi:hypothetical protein
MVHVFLASGPIWGLSRCFEVKWLSSVCFVDFLTSNL